MSMPPKPPERLAEILQEILALSGSTGKSQSESVSDGHQSELPDAYGVREVSGRREQEGNNSKKP
jgi:hypothetical protein